MKRIRARIPLCISVLLAVALPVSAAAPDTGARPDSVVASDAPAPEASVPPSDSAAVADAPDRAASQTAPVAAASALPGSDLPDTTGLVARTVLSLVAVIALIWGAVQFLKRFGPGGRTASGGRNIRVLDRAVIAPKKSIYVVQIGNKALAVGVSDDQMTTLTDLDLADTLERYPETSGNRVTERFTDVLKQVNTRFTRHTEEPAT